MKAMERVLIKMAIIQFIFLLLAQLFIHQFDKMPELRSIAKYEGVIKDEDKKTVETIWNN